MFEIFIRNDFSEPVLFETRRFRKTFEGLLYNQMFEIFIRNDFSEPVLFETRRFLNKTTFSYHSRDLQIF